MTDGSDAARLLRDRLEWALVYPGFPQTGQHEQLVEIQRLIEFVRSECSHFLGETQVGALFGGRRVVWSMDM
jgi:hypothetical protein